jgi:hypothetical protein
MEKQFNFFEGCCYPVYSDDTGSKYLMIAMPDGQLLPGIESVEIISKVNDVIKARVTLVLNAEKLASLRQVAPAPDYTEGGIVADPSGNALVGDPNPEVIIPLEKVKRFFK